MILARSGGSEYTLGIVSGVLGIGGILGGLLVSLIKLPQNTVKVLYLSAGISFVAGDLLMGLGQNLTLVHCRACGKYSYPLCKCGAECDTSIIVFQRKCREEFFPRVTRSSIVQLLPVFCLADFSQIMYLNPSCSL